MGATGGARRAAGEADEDAREATEPLRAGRGGADTTRCSRVLLRAGGIANVRDVDASDSPSELSETEAHDDVLRLCPCLGSVGPPVVPWVVAESDEGAGDEGADGRVGSLGGTIGGFRTAYAIGTALGDKWLVVATGLAGDGVA
jgi:hypothetical protein